MNVPVDQDELQMKDESNKPWVDAWKLAVRNNVKFVEVKKKCDLCGKTMTEREFAMSREYPDYGRWYHCKCGNWSIR